MPARGPLLLREGSALTLLFFGFMIGCGGGGGDAGPPPTPAAITASTGNRQIGTAGEALPQPIAARVTSAAGAGIEGITVTFAPASNSGSVSTAGAVTNADGVASTTWTLGTTAGENLDTVRASVSGVSDPAVFVATVTAGSAAALTGVSGNSQNGVAGQPLAQPLVVLAADRFGNPKDNVSVSWSVTSGGGTIAPATGITGVDGTTSAVWTPGNASANTVQAAAAGLTGSPVSFGATVTTTPSQLSRVSGNNQSGAPAQLLVQPLVVSLKTQAGAPVNGVAVSWTVTSGGGTVSQASVPTDGQGQSSVLWTLGPNEGEQGVTAAVHGATGSPIDFKATAVLSSGAVTIASITPNPIVPGQPATLMGTGFSATLSENNVTIEGIRADVTAAGTTSLTVIVPQFNCLPARRVPIQVRVGEEASNVVGQDLTPGAFTTLNVGQQLLVQNAANFCLQFAASSGPEDYLIGVQSVSETPSSLTPVTLTAVASATAATSQSAPLALSAKSPGTARQMTMQIPRRWQRHRAAELRLRKSERELLSRLRHDAFRPFTRTANRGSASGIPIVAVGDVVSMRVPDFDGDICEDFKTVDAVVRVVGANGVWLEDVDNPSGGYSAADFQAFSDDLDEVIYPTDVDYFGAPSDIDGNGRLAILITKEVNKFESPLLGFVVSTDLVDRSVCPSSAEGEIFYGIAPDPAGDFTFGPYTRENGLQDSPGLIAHEFSHVIQVSRRLVIHDFPIMATWTAEGQATLAEEVVGHQFEGRSPGQNYGFDIAFNRDDPFSIDFYSTAFFDLAFYFGAETPSSKVEDAPEECTWLAVDLGPCLSGRAVYGTPWSFLRWLSDQFGPTYPGGEKGFQRTLIDIGSVGYNNITDALGLSFRELLSQWASTLYTDDRVAGLNPRLTMASWNLFDIFENGLVESTHLIPRSRTFSSFSDDVRVRAGSAAYFRVSGTTHPATAVRVRNRSDGQLPSIMQVFVVRLQ